MSDKHNELMIRNLQDLLPPLIRLALDCHVDSRAFKALVGEAYVKVITEDYGRANRPTNIARTAMLAGLSRAETTRIRKSLSAEDNNAPPAVGDHAFSNLLREWHTNSMYLAADGTPLALTMEGDDPSVNKLFKRFFSDIPATTVIKELLSVDAVRVRKDNRYEVTRDYFMPPRANPKHIGRMGELIRDFISTVRHNLVRNENDPSRIEIRTIEQGVSQSHEAAFFKLLEDESTKLYQRIDRWLRDKRKYETIDGELTCRMGFGIYQIHRDD